MKYSIYFLLFLFLFSGFVHAQNEAIPACTEAQIQEIDKAFNQGRIIQSYKAVIRMMDNVTGTDGKLPDVIQLANDVQQRWWNEVSEQLPDCALSYRIRLVMGRLLDEMVLFNMSAHWAYLDIKTGNNQTYAVDIMNTHLTSWQGLYDPIDGLVRE